MTTDKHVCPARNCSARISYYLLMCKPHWELVPPEIQRKVYRTWNRGKGAGSAEHARAMREAVNAVNSHPAMAGVVDGD